MTFEYRVTPESVPFLQLTHLSDDERGMVERLQTLVQYDLAEMRTADAYFKGEQDLKSLGISIPKELSGLRTVTGWARTPVMPYVERLEVDGFRYPGQTDADDDLMAAWIGSGMDSELSVGLIDALVMGRGYLWIGSGDQGDDLPRMTCESPQNVITDTDPRTRRARAAMCTYWVGEEVHGELAIPGQTIHLAQDRFTAEWRLIDRDVHGMDVVPVVAMPNMSRTNRRDGASEITCELRTIIDAACRVLQQMQVAGEFYSVPKLAFLGIAAEDFQKSDGSATSAAEAYINRAMTFERDEDGQVPQIWQATPYNPAVFTEVLNLLAAQAASICRAPAQDFGLYTQGNPISADAMHVSESGRDRHARLMQRMFGARLREAMQVVSMFMNKGVLSDDARRLEVDWVPPEMFSMSGASDAITKQIAAGSIPARSDVTLRRLGYSAVERARLAQDAEQDQAEQLLAEIASSITTHDLRAGHAIGSDEKRAAQPVTGGQDGAAAADGQPPAA